MEKTYPILEGEQFADKSFQDPKVPKYHLAFWIGAGSAGMEIVAPNDLSAVTVAMFTAQQHYPHVTGISIYERTGPGPEDLGRVVVFAPLMQFFSQAAKIIGTVSGSPVSVPHSVIQTPEAGFGDLQQKVKGAAGGMPVAQPAALPPGPSPAKAVAPPAPVLPPPVAPTVAPPGGGTA